MTKARAIDPVPDQTHLLGTHGWKDGRAWHHDYKSGLKVWTPKQTRGALTKIRERLDDWETLKNVAEDAFNNVYDGPGSGDPAWEACVKEIARYVKYGHIEKS